MATSVQADEIIAFESADDDFRFWLARAAGPATVYSGPKKTENGVNFVSGGLYITVQYYERFPPSSLTTFKLSPQVWVENAEGVISRQVPVTHITGRHTRQSHSAQLLTLSADACNALNDMPSLN